MSQDLSRRLLSDLLSPGPLKGAQLAHRLRRAYEMQTGKPFDLWHREFQGFSRFLEMHADLVLVTKPEGEGDIEVRLQPSPQPHARDTESAEEATPRRLPAAIWQAFTNPDPSRRRFFNRRTGEVAHHREGSGDLGDERARVRIGLWSSDAVPIVPIPAATQHGWMHAYLSSLPLDTHERDALDRLLATNYTSHLNLMFSRALGNRDASSWREFRLRRVNEIAEKWARENGISLDQLAGSESRVTAAAGESMQAVQTSELRQRLHALIDGIADDEVERVLVPLATVARLIDRTTRG